MADADKKPDTLPQGVAIAVFLVVIGLIALVLISLRIPHALRPSIQQAPVTTVVTVTPTG
ncbi:MAG TPA: hypothetical protein VJ831_00730 [Jatrophihabitantaceae bacterium]|nr:hypothetical protein [Jatrophihabitantaceae bacterium]